MVPTMEATASPGAGMVCGCLALSAADIERCAARGAGDAERVAADCGASTHCGACAQAVIRLVGDPGGVRVRATVDRVGDDALRIVLRPAAGGEFDASCRPGQHAVLAVRGPFGWIARPYTVTSPAEDRSQRELIVRIRPGGRMGAALLALASAPDAAEIRLGRPQGRAFGRLTAKRPVAFLCGGVGLTPALAALRAGASLRPILVHASFRTAEPVLEPLLRECCGERGAALVVHHEDRDGLPTTASLGEVIASLPRVDWFVCGPDGYRDVAFAALRQAGIPARRIHEERFVAAAEAAGPAPARQRTVAEARWAKLAVALSVAWLVSVALPRPDAWLTLASEDVFRWVTGWALFVVLAVQWLFPIARGRGRYDRAMRLELWHRASGSVAPAILLLHQRSFGHGLLLALGVALVANTVLGAFDKTAVRDGVRRERWLRLWLPAHVVLSCTVTGLALWHLWMVVRYQGALV